MPQRLPGPGARCLGTGEGRPLWGCFPCERHMFPLPGIFPSSLNPASRSGRFICSLTRADISCTACYTCCTELWWGRYPPATEQSPSNTSLRPLWGPNWGSRLLYLQGDIQVVTVWILGLNPTCSLGPVPASEGSFLLMRKG